MRSSSNWQWCFFFLHLLAQLHLSTLARLGGDEFAVVLAARRRGDAPAPPACGCAPRSSARSRVGGIRVHIDASVGIALFPEHADGRARAAAARRRRDVRGQAHAHRPRGLPARARPPQPPAGSSCSGELRDGAATPASSSCTTSRRRRSRPARCAASRRSCAGRTRGAACWCRRDFLPLVEHSGLGRALTAFVLDRALEEIGDRRRRRVRPQRRRQPRARRPARPRAAVGGRAAARAAPLPARRACGSRSPRTS